jgi:hypothetical protein
MSFLHRTYCFNISRITLQGECKWRISSSSDFLETSSYCNNMPQIKSHLPGKASMQYKSRHYTKVAVKSNGNTTTYLDANIVLRWPNPEINTQRTCLRVQYVSKIQPDFRALDNIVTSIQFPIEPIKFCRSKFIPFKTLC